MNKCITDSIFSNIKIDTYKKLEKIFNYGSVLSPLVYLSSCFVNQGFIGLITMWFFLGGNCIFDVCNLHKTKEGTEILGIYNRFIKNYNELNRTFGFNHPVEVFAMFDYLLHEGYLSKNMEFDFSDENVIDVPKLYGVNIFNGDGVCRHISYLLNDIFNDYGMKGEKISVYQRKLISFDDEQVKSILENAKEILLNKSNDIDVSFFDVVMQKIKESASLEPFNYNRLTRSNHAINYVEYDNIGYYFDPTQSTIYDKNNNSMYLSDEIGDRNYIINRDKKKQFLASNNRYDDLLFMRDIVSLCKKNIDIFEKFYKENKELYEEISHKSLILKPKKS